jgi:hypothetical protein
MYPLDSLTLLMRFGMGFSLTAGHDFGRGRKERRGVGCKMGAETTRCLFLCHDHVTT